MKKSSLWKTLNCHISRILYCGLIFLSSVYISSSSSLRQAACTDFPNSFWPSGSIIHCSLNVYQATSCVRTELLLISSGWSSYICTSVWRGPLENAADMFVLAPSAVSHMSCSFNLNSLGEGGRWLYSCCFVECCFQRGVCFTIQSAVNSFLIHENVVYQCFSIICVGVGP